MNEIIKNDKIGEIIINEQNKQWIKCDSKSAPNGDTIKKYTILPMELSEYIKKNVPFIFAKSATSDEPLAYFYVNGVYKWVQDNELKGYIKSFIPYQLRKSKDINEILMDLKTENRFVDISELNKDESIINFQDGIYDIYKKKLLPHSPKYFSTIQIPVKYEDVQNAKFSDAPNFISYIKTLCTDDKELIKLLWECMALCISNIYGYRTKKAMFLIGKGNSGKSQIKKLIENLVGSENFSAVELKQLNERFGASLIYQKRLSGSNDMTFSTIEDMSMFKQLTGGDTIVMEFKNKQSFSYTYRGFLWFNCNKMPKFGGDTGKWVYDRILPVYCNNVVPTEKQDKFLFDKMWDERSAIVKILLNQLDNFIKNDFQLSEPECLEKNRQEYEMENNTFLSFINDCCYYREDGVMTSLRVKRSTFRNAYKKYVYQYCRGRGEIGWADMKNLLEEKFGEEFQKTNGTWFLSKVNLQDDAIRDLEVNDTYLDKYTSF